MESPALTKLKPSGDGPPSGRATAGADTFVWVQGRRGIAAALVVLYHYLGFIAKGQSGESLLSPFGASGVDVFFVISGFIMMISTDRPGMTAGAFLRRRFLRIVPLYWVLTVAAFILATIVSPGGVTAQLGGTA